MAKHTKQSASGTGALTKRPPVVAILGHIDHGKSTLLDYIRKTNIVEGEAGGITQRISAYEVERGDQKITFIDTPARSVRRHARARSEHGRHRHPRRIRRRRREATDHRRI